jgi:hypothetical protein
MSTSTMDRGFVNSGMYDSGKTNISCFYNNNVLLICDFNSNYLLTPIQWTEILSTVECTTLEKQISTVKLDIYFPVLWRFYPLLDRCTVYP